MRLEPLHRIPVCAPRPGDSVQRMGSRPVPGRGHGHIERIDAEREIIGDGAQERAVGSPGATRGARDRRDEVAPKPPGGALPQDVEPVADLHFLQVADVRIEGGNRGIPVCREVDREVCSEAAALGRLDDVASDAVSPGGIERAGKGVLVDQGFELFGGPVALGPGHGGGEVVHDHALGAALGLRSLARIIHDEGVDVGCRSEGDLRPAGRR